MSYNQLSESQQKVLLDYKTNRDLFAFDINQSLKDNCIVKFEREIELLDSVLKLSYFDCNMTLYRATYERDICRFINDGVYINPDYLSTSTSQLSIRSFFSEPEGIVFLTLECSKKVNYYNMEEIDGAGGSENEYLIGRNNQFEVVKNYETSDKTVIGDIIGNSTNLPNFKVSKIRIIQVKSIE